MKVFERYFERNKLYFTPEFTNEPDVIVIIPVLNDPDIFATVDSLCHCSSKEGNIGVIIVVNHGENATEEVKIANGTLVMQLRRYVGEKQSRNAGICFLIAEAFDLPAKTAGVGLARKIAMDAAAFWFYQHGRYDNPILSLDADTWVDSNYTDEACCYFRTHPVAGVSIAYAHRLDECSGDTLGAMIKYELYLRYYQLALAYTGHPHAYHCIGSAFAVRASDYVAQGGMNKRQAGEDFYFLQKLISTGRYALLKSTRVYPSARFSDRTPFGTGQSVRQIVGNEGVYPVYHFDAFRDLRYFFDGVSSLYKADDSAVADYFAGQRPGVRQFLSTINGEAMLAEVNANCASLHQFRRRFFDHFNAFRVLKYLNYVHEGLYLKTDISQAVDALFLESGYPLADCDEGRLTFLRNL